MAAFETDRVRRFAGWSAYVSAGLSIIGGIALFLFYGLEAPRTIATGNASQHSSARSATTLACSSFSRCYP